LGPQNPKDPKSVQAWIDQLRSAAENGDSNAQKRLAGCYYEGTGVPKDLVRSYAWMNVSLALHPIPSPNELDFLSGKMTPKQRAEGQKLSRELHAKAVANMKKLDKGNLQNLSELLVNKRIKWKGLGWTQFFANGRYVEGDGDTGTYSVKGNMLTMKFGARSYNYEFLDGGVSVGGNVKCKETKIILTIESIN